MYMSKHHSLVKVYSQIKKGLKSIKVIKMFTNKLVLKKCIAHYVKDMKNYNAVMQYVIHY